MWKKEITIKTKATKEQIWTLWSDVKNWNEWDKEVQSSEINGDFKEGIKGVIKPLNGPKSEFVLKSVNYPLEFITISNLPLARMRFTHNLRENNGELLITHGVEISGLTTFIFSKLIGEKIVSELPKTLENLSKKAKLL